MTEPTRPASLAARVSRWLRAVSPRRQPAPAAYNPQVAADLNCQVEEAMHKHDPWW